MKKLILSSLAIIILGVGVFGVTSRILADQTPTVTQFRFAGYYCSPSGKVSPTTSYPDGIHPVQVPADPDAVAGQVLLQSATQDMINQQNKIVEDHATNSSDDQKVLNTYTQKVNDLTAKFDNCIPLNQSPWHN